MKRNLKPQDITKVLRGMAKENPGEAVFEKVWYKLEDHIASRTQHFWQNITWKPWGHPVRWVAAACLCLAFTGMLYNNISYTNDKDMASFIMSVSNPTANVTHDLGMVNVSVLLSAPSTSGVELLKADEEHSNVLAGDEILL